MNYIVIILVSVFLVRIAETRENKHEKILFLILSVLISSVFAGVRSYDTGVDIKSYVLYHFDEAKISTLAEYVDNHGPESILYSIMICTIAKIFPTAHWMLFFIQLYINSFFYIAAFRYKKYTNYSMTLFLFVYYCTFYIYTFNIMRQGMAVAMLIWGAVELVYNCNYKFFLIMTVASILMHPTAIVILPLIVVNKMLNSKKNLLKKTFLISGIILLTALVLVLRFREIMSFLINVGLVKKRYLNTITSLYKGHIDFENYKVAFCLANIFLVYMIKKAGCRRKKDFLLISFMVCLASYLIGGVSTFTERIGLYYWMPALCMSSGYVANLFRIKRDQKYIFKAMYCSLMLMMCVYQFFICNQAAAFPYRLM